MQNKNSLVDLGIIALSIGENQLSEVIVKGERSTVINKIDRQVFDATKFQSSQGGSATDVVRNIPSVTVDGLGEISVRGSTGFVVLLNGNPVQGNASTLLNQLPANAIERVEVITAPSAKYDPEGKAGILNIITRKGAADGAFTQINVKGGFPSIEKYDNAAAHQRYGVDATYNIIKGDWNISLGAMPTANLNWYPNFRARSISLGTSTPPTPNLLEKGMPGNMRPASVSKAWTVPSIYGINWAR